MDTSPSATAPHLSRAGSKVQRGQRLLAAASLRGQLAHQQYLAAPTQGVLQDLRAPGGGGGAEHVPACQQAVHVCQAKQLLHRRPCTDRYAGGLVFWASVPKTRVAAGAWHAMQSPGADLGQFGVSEGDVGCSLLQCTDHVACAPTAALMNPQRRSISTGARARTVVHRPLTQRRQALVDGLPPPPPRTHIACPPPPAPPGLPHSPSADRLLLMACASLSCCPVTSERSTRSDPAGQGGSAWRSASPLRAAPGQSSDPSPLPPPHLPGPPGAACWRRPESLPGRCSRCCRPLAQPQGSLAPP